MNLFNYQTDSKIIKAGIAIFLSGLVFTGCQKVTEIDIRMDVSKNSFSFSSSGGSDSFDVQTNTKNWTVNKDNAPWLSITPTSGTHDGTVEITAAPNTSTSQQTAVITIKGTGTDTKTVSVNIGGAAPTLSLSTNVISFDPSAGTQTFNIISNTTWSMTRNGDTWFNYSTNSGSNNATITLTPEMNRSGSGRIAKLTVSCAGLADQHIMVTQSTAITRLDESWRSLLRASMLSNPTENYGVAVYKGQVSDEYWHGMGALFWFDTYLDFHIGEYEYDKREGFGIYIIGKFDEYDISSCSDSKIYAGTWSGNAKHGTGACYDARGVQIYRGSFSNERPAGAYPVTNTAYRYEIFKTRTNDFFVGETYNSQWQGYGIFIWQTGDIWYGPWSNSTSNGNGIYLYRDGKVSTGIWKGL